MGSEEFSFKYLLLHPAWNLLAGGGVENREGAVGINKSRMQRGGGCTPPILNNLFVESYAHPKGST